MKPDISPQPAPLAPKRTLDGMVKPQPARPVQSSAPRVASTEQPRMLEAPDPEELLSAGELLPSGDAPKAPRPRRKLIKIIGSVLGVLILLAVAAGVAGYLWYQQQLAPVVMTQGKTDYISIEPGATTASIADVLKQKGLIRDSTAFSLYVRFSSSQEIKAGRYKVSSGQSVAEIVTHLSSGKQDQLVVTFLPGDTLANHRKRLLQAGFSEQEVDAALKATYQGSLFAGKPAQSDLEGYIFGETYQFDVGADAKTVVQRTFTQFEKEIADNGLAAKFAARGLTTFQAITLASIVQREVTIKDGDPASEQDAAKVAGVFYNRLKAGMNLGSDVTYQYAARKMGVAPDPTLQSPYNTRIHAGLPPGPIASPGLGALKAVASPATHNYLFFLSGDDDVTYFGTTDAEHQRNIQLHCKAKCLIM